VDLALVHLGVTHGALDGVKRAAEQINAQLLEGARVMLV